MKQHIKYSNIFITLVLLVLAVLCISNVTYSYFTTTSSKDGTAAFGDLNVRFLYKEKDMSAKPAESGTIVLYSASGPIQTGVEFNLSTSASGPVLESLSIQNQTGSCNCFVRFWIDAYIVRNSYVDKTINYGKYFFLEEGKNSLNTGPRQTRTGGSVEGSWCYFFTEILKPSGTSSRTIGNKMVMNDVSAQDTVPLELLGQELQITISFEAVQVANSAYLKVFGSASDAKGYYTGWSALV